MNKKAIKLLALDLDGTTLKSDATLSLQVKTALCKAVENNIIIVAASGRPYGSMPESVMSIDGVDYAITSNGAAVYDKNGTRIHNEVISEADVIKFLKLTKNYDLVYEAFINGQTYADERYVSNPVEYGCSPAYFDYVRSSRGRVGDMRSFIFENRKILDSIEYICTDKPLRELVRRHIAQHTDGFFITSSSKNFVEFSAKSATKAKGLEFLCNKLGIDKQHTSACGNADNDADMIQWAGLGAAVKTASQLCLDYADIVLPSNNEHGVATLIDYIIENNNQVNL